jgi:3-oxoacyl-[acyl-carrier-protein] synthase-3
MKYSKILGVGSYLPPTIWTNKDLITLMSPGDERAADGWVEQRTGIKERRWTDINADITSSDLGVEAAKKAIEAANIKKEDIDLVLFSTANPDHDCPGSASFFQPKLGINNIPVIDIRQHCSGFMYALSIADQFIRTEFCKTILIVSAESHFRTIRKKSDNKELSILFGDGAGAIVVGATDAPHGPRILSTHIHADGSHAKDLWQELGTEIGTMNGQAVFVHACRRMPEAINEAVSANNLQLSDIDFFVFHQANLRINDMVGKKLGISPDKVLNTIQKYGNTNSASIPIGLDEAIKANKIKPGMLVACAAFGAGFHWSSAIIRW